MAHYSGRSITQDSQKPRQSFTFCCDFEVLPAERNPSRPSREQGPERSGKLADTTRGPMSHSNFHSLASRPLLIRTLLLVSASPAAFWAGISNCFNHHSLIIRIFIQTPRLLLPAILRPCKRNKPKTGIPPDKHQICQTQFKRLNKICDLEFLRWGPNQLPQIRVGFSGGLSCHTLSLSNDGELSSFRPGSGHSLGTERERSILRQMVPRRLSTKQTQEPSSVIASRPR